MNASKFLIKRAVEEVPPGDASETLLRSIHGHPAVSYPVGVLGGATLGGSLGLLSTGGMPGAAAGGILGAGAMLPLLRMSRQQTKEKLRKAIDAAGGIDNPQAVKAMMEEIAPKYSTGIPGGALVGGGLGAAGMLAAAKNVMGQRAVNALSHVGVPSRPLLRAGLTGGIGGAALGAGFGALVTALSRATQRSQLREGVQKAREEGQK